MSGRGAIGMYHCANLVLHLANVVIVPAATNTAIGSLPGYADARHQRGVSESELGDTGAARADWNTAMSSATPARANPAPTRPG